MIDGLDGASIDLLYGYFGRAIVAMRARLGVHGVFILYHIGSL
jgi:hypothetical protein